MRAQEETRQGNGAQAVAWRGAGMAVRRVIRVPVTERVLALTFDDGSTPRGTPQILRVLRENPVRATSLVIGHRPSATPVPLPRKFATEWRWEVKLQPPGAAEEERRSEVDRAQQAITAAGED